jgi:hypothetical protein
VTTYAGVIQNLYGKDRQDALDAMDDDAAFDRWMANYSRKQQQDSQRSGGSKSRSGKTAIDKDTYLNSMARINEGE